MKTALVRASGARSWIGIGVGLACLLFTVLTRPGEAQLLGVRGGYSQVLTSTEGWRSPSGFSLGAVAPTGLKRLGLRLEYRSTADPGEPAAQECDFAGCRPGPFDQSFFLRSIGFGVISSVGAIGPMIVAGSVDLSLYWQGRRITHQTTGERHDSGSVLDYGVGPGIEIRLPAIVAGLRPLVSGRFDFVRARPCAADASCYGDRGVTTLGVSLEWGAG
jgi:hypothetical protein